MATTEAPEPVVVPAAPAVTSKRTLWQKIKTRQFLFYSIVFHVLLAGGFMLWKIHDESTERKKFMAPGAGADAARQGAEHKVSLGRKQSTMSAPEQAKRVTTNSATAKVALPEMPDMPTATTDVFANRAIGLGGAGSAFGATGTPGGGGNGGGSGINFFGLRTRAHTIVFLVDVSSSMVMSSALPPGVATNGADGKPQKGPHTYAALEREVARAIRALDPSMTFSVICFAGDVEAYNPLLVKVTDTEKEHAIQFINRHSPGLNLVAEQRAADRRNAGFKEDPNASHSVTHFNDGGTRASAALDMAFAMNPDAICFVSDGIPSDGTAKDILAKVAAHQKELPRPAQIHVVAYLADSGQAFMKALAEQNQGSYKEIKPGMASYGF